MDMNEHGCLMCHISLRMTSDEKLLALTGLYHHMRAFSLLYVLLNRQTKHTS